MGADLTACPGKSAICLPLSVCNAAFAASRVLYFMNPKLHNPTICHAQVGFKIAAAVSDSAAVSDISLPEVMASLSVSMLHPAKRRPPSWVVRKRGGWHGRL